MASELVAAAAEGPRASERFAVVAAALVAGLAGAAGAAEPVANFLARTAAALERAMTVHEDSLARGNLVLVVAHLYLAGALKADLVYDLLAAWRARFSDADVAAMAALLGAAGLALRAADPERMKAFVVEVHAAAAAAGGAAALPPRTRVMLELVVDVKNNRQRRERGAAGAGPALAPAAARWLKGAGAAGVAVGGITWEKVLRGDKRGVWWEPTAADAIAAASAAARAAGSGPAAAALGDADLGGDGGAAPAELLRLAAAMRMNTDARRAVFCVVMGSEDCVDALEKLLRLGLRGDSEREVVRVAVECCLQEAAWNPYYAHLLARLAAAGRAHRVTLQFCFWDQLKELPAAGVRRLTNLARLGGALVAGGALPGGALKAAGLGEELSAREVLFWRLFFEHAFACAASDEACEAVFARIAANKELQGLRAALRRFLKRSVGPWLAEKKEPAGGRGGEARLAAALQRCRQAERALARAG